MAYTPELSMRSCCTLRWLSWALGMPMTEGIEFLFDYLPQIMDREKVCQGYRESSPCRKSCRRGFLFEGKWPRTRRSANG
jgi:hypothetical protein